MRCALVFYFVATIFVIVYSAPELCVFEDWYWVKVALCGNHSVNYTFDFIPPISQYIELIDLDGQPLKQLPYNAFRNVSSQSSMSRIWLQHCQISHVDAGALLNLHNLTTIRLSYNDITHIDSKLFRHTKKIKFIDMNHNKIEVLPSGIFQNLTLLEAVYLSNNRIRQVENDSFKNTPSLWAIDLSNNTIEFMSILFKDKFDKLRYLLLYGNPWKCDCELGPLYALLIKINMTNKFAPVCDEPPTLHGRKWTDISRDEFVCSSEDSISTQDSVITTTSTEPMTTTELDDIVPVLVHKGTKYQPVDTGIAQSPSNQNWIQYTILVLVLVGVAVLTIGVVFVVRYTLVKSNNRHRVRLPTIIKRRSFRTNARQMDSGIPMRVIQSSAVSEDSDSASNTDDENEEHQYAIREATTD